MRLRYSPALLLAVFWGGVGSVRAEPPGTPIVEAKDGVTVQADDATTLTRLTAKPGKRAWLIRLSKAWYIAPPARSCEVYLRPEVQSKRLRRGELRRGIGNDEPEGKTRWELAERPYAYAQVSPPGQPFESEKTSLVASDGPFAVTGKISNQNLVQVVDFVRAKNPPEDPPPTVSHFETNADGSVEEIIGSAKRSFHASIDHDLPILHLEAKDADHIEITTSTGNGSGQRIDLQRENARWKIMQVGQWNA